ncbi:MAG: PAS-domain containing protein, partial [Sneathiella sp.]|nr:PAS-domain containing protein [Sneathiella sp.]
KNDLIASVLETSKQGILLFDKNYSIQLTNQRFLELLDIPEELARPGTPYRDVIHFLTMRGEYGERSTGSVYQQFVDISESNTPIHFQRIRPNGTILDIEATWIPGLGFLTTYSDVTQQAHAEIELKKSEEKFRDFTDSASDWLWELDKDLHFTYVSALGLTISGRTMDDLNGMSLRELFFESVNDEQWEAYAAHLKDHKPFKDLEYLYSHPDGSELHFSSSGKAIFDKKGDFNGYRGIGSDITAKKHFEQQLHNSQKMEAIGRLSGGIAHDFNNLLTIIIGNAELLRENCEDHYEEAIPMLKIVEKAALRGADLTQQMLAYSRKQKLSPTSIDLIEGISGIVHLIGRSLAGDITISVHHVEDSWQALCDQSRLEDAIINLANNARDAMPNGGTLTITTSNFVQEKESSDDDTTILESGEYAVISVKDTGIGMSDETAAQVFEPFFTTKDIGKGTGLGLSMVFGFAKQSNGHVAIDSELGIGTMVNLYLPRATVEGTTMKDLPQKETVSQ